MRRPGRLLTLLTVATLVATACGTTGPTGTATPTETVPAERSAAGAAGDDTGLVVSGTIEVSPAQSFEDAGFHHVAVATADLTYPPAADAPQRLTLELVDTAHPGRTCSSEHPLSGCVTVDWSDAPGRPHVPDGGVFVNQVTLVGDSGATTWHLRADDNLSPEPEPFAPG